MSEQKNDDIKIKEPQVDDIEDSPIKPKVRKHDGINIIEGIYDFFTGKKPIGFCIIERYKDDLSLKIEHPLLYRAFLILMLILDTFHAIVAITCIALILVLIVISFARGIGILDLLIHFRGY